MKDFFISTLWVILYLGMTSVVSKDLGLNPVPEADQPLDTRRTPGNGPSKSDGPFSLVLDKSAGFSLKWSVKREKNGAEEGTLHLSISIKPEYNWVGMGFSNEEDSDLTDWFIAWHSQNGKLYYKVNLVLKPGQIEFVVGSWLRPIEFIIALNCSLVLLSPWLPKPFDFMMTMCYQTCKNSILTYFDPFIV